MSKRSNEDVGTCECTRDNIDVGPPGVLPSAPFGAAWFAGDAAASA
jgi:hypothetical protein